MKKNFSISISYPPLESKKGIPFLAQNRQFQWTNTGNVILPVIPAYAATALHNLGYKVYWDDAIAQNISYSTWLKRIIKRKPNIIAIESKTPVIKKHWQIISDIRQHQTKTWIPTIVLMGDHVTALPKESLLNSSVDYVITGGDYDFMLLNLVDHLVNKTKLEPGFYFRSNVPNLSRSNIPAYQRTSLSNAPAFQRSKALSNSGPFALKHHNLDQLPIIDRTLTQHQLYGYRNTNFKYRPGAYIMSGRDCWWGKCTYCSWTTTHPSGTFRYFSVKHTIAEIENLVNNFGVKEIFDDSGTLPVGKWLNDLCIQLISTGLNKKVVLGCNMRFAALNQEQYNLMKQAGFRFILYGLESSNQKTLDKINKNTKTSDAKHTLTLATNAKLQPHLTVMIGYPWENKTDALNTLNQAKSLFKLGLADSLQATIIIPYPGTPLFKTCDKENLLLTKNWNNYDMRQPIMKSPLSDTEQKELVQDIFKGIISPQYIFRQITSIRNLDDIRHLFFYTIKYLQKLNDFKPSESN